MKNFIQIYLRITHEPRDDTCTYHLKLLKLKTFFLNVHIDIET